MKDFFQKVVSWVQTPVLAFSELIWVFYHPILPGLRPAVARIGIRRSRLWSQLLDLMTEFQAKSRISLGWNWWEVWGLGKSAWINWKATLCVICIYIYYTHTYIYICGCIYLWKPTARELKSWEAKNLRFLTRRIPKFDLQPLGGFDADGRWPMAVLFCLGWITRTVKKRII